MRGVTGRLFLLVAGIVAIFFTLSPSDVKADTIDATITGRAVYTNANGDPSGIEGAKVNVCDSDGIFGNQCVTTRTGPDGSFEAALSDTFEDDNDIEVFVEVIADSPGVVVGPHLTPFTYCYKTGTLVVSAGGTKDFGDVAPLSNNSCGAFSAPHTDPRENAGFYVFTQLHRAWQYLNGITQSVNGEAVPKVTARLVPGGGSDADDVSFYALGTITLQPNSWQIGSDYGFMTIFHEYGHHLLGHFAESPLPDYVNGNCDDVDPFLILEIPDPGHCKWLSEKGVAAWTEGFPTFLAAVLENELYGTNRISEGDNAFSHGGDNYYYGGAEFPAMRIVNTQEDVLYTLGDSQGIVESHPDTDYTHVEGWTTAVLWDVYDSAADNHDKDGTRDTLSASFRDIWSVVSNYDPDTGDDGHNHPLDLQEFYDGLVDLFSGKYSQARIAGPFLENHIAVPATDLSVSVLSHADWNSNDVFGRGDVLTAHYEVCRPLSADIGWGGEGQVGVSLLVPGTSQHAMDFPPLALPDVAPGACTAGIYEFEIPADMELSGPAYIGGTLFDSQSVFDAVVCADPASLLTEANEDNNCRPPHTLRLQNRPPEVVTNAGPDGFVLDEGSDLVIDFTGSFDPDPIPGKEELRYTVAGAGIDSVFLGISGPVMTFTAEQIAALADGTDPAAPMELVLGVYDGDRDDLSSTAMGFAIVPLVVNNVEPVALISNASTATLPAYTIFEGSNATIYGNFFDPGADTWEVSAYFFDADDLVAGTVTQEPDDDFHVGNWELSRFFGNETSGKGMDFLLCVADDDGGEGCAEGILKVLNVAPSLVLEPTVSVSEGDASPVSGSFTDPGEDTWTATYAVDGGAPQALTLAEDKTFTVPVTFTQDGQHSVEVCVNDGTATACQATTVEVQNVAPDFSLSSPVVLDEGSSLNITGSFTDPGAETWTATVAYDGGSLEPLALDGMSFAIDRSYPQDGSFSVEVCISDDDATTCHTAEITVLNVAPGFSLDSPVVLDEGGSLHLDESFIDPGADTWTATIAYDGGAQEVLMLDGMAFMVDRAYPEDGSYSIEVCISDDDDTTCRSVGVTVMNVAPAVTLTTTPDLLLALVEDTVTATFDDPGVLDTHTATVDWGDGTVEALTIEAHATETGAIAGSHAYSTTGEFTVEICVRDDELDSGCASFTLRVATPAEAATGVINDLSAVADTDSVAADALRELQGINPRSASGALDKIESGDYVAALTKLYKAVVALDASDDYSATQLLLTQIAESVARERLAAAEALGTADQATLDGISLAIASGRALLEAGDYAAAVNTFKSAVQQAEKLL